MIQESKVVTLGDVCEKGSSGVSQNQLEKETGPFPIYGASGFIKNVSFYHNSKPYISIVKDGSGFGRVTIMEAYSSVIGTLQYIFPKEGIDLKYLYYSLISIDFKKYVAGAAIPHIYFKDYKNESFLWMPLPEQQRIVAVLDEAFAAIDQAKANTERNLKNAKELFDSYLQEVFEKRGAGWEEITLADVCDLNHGFAFEGTDFEIDFNGLKPIVLTPGNFTEDCRLSFTPKNTKRLKSNFSRDFLFDVGELVVVMTDLSPLMKILGKPAIIDREGILHNQRIGRFVFKENTIEKRYLFYFLQTYKYLNSVRESATGTMVRHTAPKRILRLTIPIPKSKESQQTIICQLDDLKAEIQKLEAVYHKKLLDLDELKKSILQKAFAGELTTA